MYSTVKTLRSRGKKKDMREIQSDPGVSGDLVLALCGSLYELKIHATDDSTMQPIIPSLLDARLISMHNGKMLFRGFEQGSDGAEWAQEWSVLAMPR